MINLLAQVQPTSVVPMTALDLFILLFIPIVYLILLASMTAMLVIELKYGVFDKSARALSKKLKTLKRGL